MERCPVRERELCGEGLKAFRWSFLFQGEVRSLISAVVVQPLRFDRGAAVESPEPDTFAFPERRLRIALVHLNLRPRSKKGSSGLPSPPQIATA
jgi:hypothetical protein